MTIKNNLAAATTSGWVNPAGGDFHLTSGSPARDAGTTLPQVRLDKEGRSRPQGPAYDLGAFEYQAP